MKSEWDMVLDCKDYFETQQQYQKIECEIPFLSRCIDMVLVDSNDKITTIEFKLSKWRDAISQAHDHMRGADYAYVCLPKRRPSQQLISELEASGIGLLLYDEKALDGDKVIVYTQAPESSRKVPLFSDNLLKMVDICCEC
ncbi:MAG: hypothetical protein Q4G60_13285 [bacterium]|nr:hypothetical protein [bacterium]